MCEVEIWKEFLDGYEVSSHGRVRSWRYQGGRKGTWTKRDTPFYLKLNSDRGGYKEIVKLKKKYRIHRVVLERFHGPCPLNMQASHLDGNPANNCIDNLIWETPKQNHARKREHGTAQRGENNPKAKLTNDQVREIKALLKKDHLFQREIAKKYNVHRITISQIKTGRNWSHI